MTGFRGKADPQTCRSEWLEFARNGHSEASVFGTPNGWNRPGSVIHFGPRERRFPDRKTDIGYSEPAVPRTSFGFLRIGGQGMGRGHLGPRKATADTVVIRLEADQGRAHYAIVNRDRG